MDKLQKGTYNECVFLDVQYTRCGCGDCELVVSKGDSKAHAMKSQPLVRFEVFDIDFVKFRGVRGHATSTLFQTLNLC